MGKSDKGEKTTIEEEEETEEPEDKKPKEKKKREKREKKERIRKRKEKSEKKEKGKEEKEKKAKIEEKEKGEEEPVKYTIIMWLAIVLMFFGALLSVLGVWMSNSTFGILAVIFLVVGIPVFIWQYLKMDALGKAGVRRSALLLLRDVGIAFLIVGIIIGAIIAYSGTSPFMVVVESDSMQHSGAESYIGAIDTGDVVLVKNAPAKIDITTYIEGRGRDYRTYGDYGDVIVYRKCGAPPEMTPIIHRSMAYLVWNNSSFDIPALEKLEVNKDWGGTNSDGSNVSSPYNLTGIIWINNVGYADRNFTITISRYIDVRNDYNISSFYLTAGDHNVGRNHAYPDPFGQCEGIVQQEWIIGVARGELPWFGLIKLTLSPEDSGCCRGWADPAAPKNSWDSLLIALVVIITIPFTLDFAIGYILEKREKEKERKKTEKKAKLKMEEKRVKKVKRKKELKKGKESKERLGKKIEKKEEIKRVRKIKRKVKKL